MVLSSNFNYIWKFFNYEFIHIIFFGLINCIKFSFSFWKGFFIHENKFNTYYNMF
jgi:hypothetical protein